MSSGANASRSNHPPPTPERVYRRARVLLSVTARSLFELLPERWSEVARLRTWMVREALWEDAEPAEVALLSAAPGTLAAQDAIDGGWRIEGVAMLCWALGLAPLPAPDEQPEPLRYRAMLGFLGTAPTLGLRLRSEHELAEVFDEACARRAWALSRLADSRVASPGVADDVEIGDVELGDVEIGDVEMGDVEMGDVEIGDVEIGDVEIGDVATGEAELDAARNTLRLDDPPAREMDPDDVQTQDVRTDELRVVRDDEVHTERDLHATAAEVPDPATDPDVSLDVRHTARELGLRRCASSAHERCVALGWLLGRADAYEAVAATLSADR